MEQAFVTVEPECLQGTFTLRQRPIGSSECNMGDKQSEHVPSWVAVLGDVARAVDKYCDRMNPVRDC